MVRKQAEFEQTIAGLAKAGGVGVETVRYYQRRGLLPTPARSGLPGHGSGVRRYGDDDLRRLRFVRGAQAAGFTLAEIKELLALDATLDRRRARELAQARIDDLDLRIEQLISAKAALSTLIRRCEDDADGPCPIIATF